MKYSNKIKTKWRFSLTLFLIMLGILFCLVIALLYVFPIRLTHQNIQKNEKWYAKLFVFWPESPIKTEFMERKQIKRYSKVGLQKRLEKQLKNMDFLNTILYDVWLDKNAEVITNGSMSVPDNTTFFWPVLIDSRNSSADANDKTKNRNVYFVLFPDFEKVKARQGMYLSSGDSLKSNLPVLNAKKYLIFEALPLMPGHIKISLGQYVWTRTFSESEVHKVARFFIPINDPLAQNYKFTNVSTNLYLLDLKIIIKTENGREPVYLARDSILWEKNQRNISLAESADPLMETQNTSILVDRDVTLAKGYNTIFITFHDLEPELLKNKKLFLKLMPELAQFYSQSLVIKNALDATSNNENNFKIPQIYKRYGYKTALFANIETVSLSKDLTSFKDFNTLSKSWLVDSDVYLQQSSSEKHEINHELEGLNAIFKSETKTQSKGMEQKQFTMLSEYLKILSHSLNQPNKLKFDENFLFSNEHYIPNILSAFQTWSLSQVQNRFFVDLALTPDTTLSQLNLQDFASVFFKTKTLNIKKMCQYAKMRIFDREFKYTIDTLQARHLTNRTLIFVVIKNKKNPEKSSALIFIPGLKPKMVSYKEPITLQDLVFYAMSLVGIPLETDLTFASSYTNPESKKTIQLQLSPQLDDTQYTKYNLVVYPNKKNCNNFTWRAADANIFNVNANVPFYQVSSPNTLEFFPCSFGEKILKIEWYQQRLANAKPVLNHKYSKFNHINGYFIPPTDKNSVEFYFGKNFINHMNFPINFQHTPKQMNDLFMVDKKEIDQMSTLAVKSFEIMRSDSKLPGHTQAALLISNAF